MQALGFLPQMKTITLRSLGGISFFSSSSSASIPTLSFFSSSLPSFSPSISLPSFFSTTTTSSSSTSSSSTSSSSTSSSSTSSSSTSSGETSEHKYGSSATKVDYLLPHPKWTEEELKSVSTQWSKPQNAREYIAQAAIRIIRFNFDILTGFRFNPTEGRWLSRMVFLETIAGVPGFCGAAIRHLRSLRMMERDRGWIHSLVGEAENERMHLLSFLEMKKPGLFMRLMVALSQGVFWNFYFLVFLLSPKLAFALVCRLEVEAVKTYTHCLEEIEHGSLQHWKTKPAPEIAKKYWQLGEQGTVRDMIYHIRADEAHHRHVNHVFSNLRPYQDPNPFDI